MQLQGNTSALPGKLTQRTRPQATAALEGHFALVVPVCTLAVDEAAHEGFAPLAERASRYGLVIMRHETAERIGAGDLSLGRALPGELDSPGEIVVGRATGGPAVARLQSRYLWRGIPLPEVVGDGKVSQSLHSRAFPEVVAEYQRWGLGVLVDWGADPDAVRSLRPTPEWPSTSFGDAARGLFAALHDAGAKTLVEHLAGPAFDELKLVEARLGRALPDGLRAMYAQHNGQLAPESAPLFGDGADFLPLLDGLRVTGDLCRLQLSFDPEPQFYDHVEGLFLPDERGPEWFCFAQRPNFFLVVSLVTGRVLELERKFEARVVADSFEAFVADYATELRAGDYQLLDGSDEAPPLGLKAGLFRD